MTEADKALSQLLFFINRVFLFFYRFGNCFVTYAYSKQDILIAEENRLADYKLFEQLDLNKGSEVMEMKNMGVRLAASAMAVMLFSQTAMAAGSVNTSAAAVSAPTADIQKAEQNQWQSYVAEWINRNPGDMLSTNKETLITNFGKGSTEKLADGNESLTYKLQCFDVKDARVAFEISAKSKENNIEKIVVNFPENTKRDELVNSVVKNIGPSYKEETSEKDSYYSSEWKYKQADFHLYEKKGQLSMYISHLGKLDVKDLTGVAKNLEEIQANLIDLDKDGKKEQVIVAGKKYVDEKGEPSAFMSNLYLITKADGKNPVVTSMKKDIDGGYEAEALFADMNNDGKKEILISAPTGGSGGMINYNMFTYENGKPVHVFDNEQADNMIVMKSAKYVDGFKAELNIAASGKEYKSVLDLSGKKKEYIEAKVYDAKGKLLQAVEPWGTYAQVARFTVPDKQGISELELLGAINGTCNADDIASFKANLQMTKDGFKVSDVKVTILPLPQE